MSIEDDFIAMTTDIERARAMAGTCPLCSHDHARSGMLCGECENTMCSRVYVGPLGAGPEGWRDWREVVEGAWSLWEGNDDAAS